jgi:protein tyrosine phosphatase type IVA
MNHRAPLAQKPTFIEQDNHRFLIMDAPTDQNLPAYIEELKKFNVHNIVRACEPTYSTSPLTAAHMQVHEIPFPDGDSPPSAVVTQWLDLCDQEFGKESKHDGSTLAVHCVAGLGRAPVLVVIALIEHGMDALDAIQKVRAKRRGAINANQLKFLESYEPRRKESCCAIM